MASFLGGGIIGCTTAYYLTRHPAFDRSRHRVTVLEASTVAAGASGKAGGLLATWAYPEPLVKLSYQLHAELAAEHGGEKRWGYRKLECGSLEAKGRHPTTMSPLAVGLTTEARLEPVEGAIPKNWDKLPKQNEQASSLWMPESILPNDLTWFDGTQVLSWAEMGAPGVSSETAQVHPLHFTTAVAELAREGGAIIVEGAKVTAIKSDANEGVKEVVYEERFVATQQEKRDGDSTPPSLVTIADPTHVVVCAGPWTGKLLPRSGIGGPRAHSVVYDVDVSPYAIFTEIELPNDFIPEHRRRKGQRRTHKPFVDPEVYARPFGEVYACGA